MCFSFVIVGRPGGRVGRMLVSRISRPPISKITFLTWWSRYALRNERSGLLDHQPPCNDSIREATVSLRGVWQLSRLQIQGL
jgi:hypothetical protein